VKCINWHAELHTLFTGGWDGKLISWDVRQSKPATTSTPQEGNKIYTMGLSGNRLIVGTSNRHVLIYDLRSMNAPEQRRESSLLNQTRCIRGFPDTTGYALSSIEGRVSVEYFNPEASVQKNKYAFKCHRKTEGKTQLLYPVNAMAFHPKSVARQRGRVQAQ
jgi:cell cycle arrest protein BUB3